MFNKTSTSYWCLGCEVIILSTWIWNPSYSFSADSGVVMGVHEHYLQVSFMEELGDGKELNSSAEARKLSFYLFWNIKPFFDRYPTTTYYRSAPSQAIPISIPDCRAFPILKATLSMPLPFGSVQLLSSSARMSPASLHVQELHHSSRPGALPSREGCSASHENAGRRQRRQGAS